MAQIHQCKDNSDCVTLFAAKGLFLKPISRVNVSVTFPLLKQNVMSGGKSVSSWDIMEKIKALVTPNEFICLKVVKNTLEFIRFEGDVESRTILKTIIGKLDGKSLKLTGFKEALKVRAAEAKIPFPSKYDWDSFFRDAKHMNEMKAGERPDTIHFQNLPCRWFSDRPSEEIARPSDRLFRKIWESFGEVRYIDIPCLDPYRSKMMPSLTGIKTFTFNNDQVFEAYVQFRDYMSFVKTMDALRGCMLLQQEDNKFNVAVIKVDFDKTKHLSDESIRRRKIERERLMSLEKPKVKMPKLNSDDSSDEDDAKLTSSEIEYKIALEERKYLVANRKLQAIRLVDYLFEKIKVADEKASEEKVKPKAKKNSAKIGQVMERYKEMQKARVDEQGEKLRKVILKKKKVSSSKSHRSESPRSRSPSPHGSVKSRSRSSRSRSRTPSPQDRDRDGRGHSHDAEYERREDRYQQQTSHTRFVGDWEVHHHPYNNYKQYGNRYRRPKFHDEDPSADPRHRRRYPHPHYNRPGNFGHRYAPYDRNHYYHQRRPPRNEFPGYLSDLDHAYEKYFKSISERDRHPSKSSVDAEGKVKDTSSPKA